LSSLKQARRERLLDVAEAIFVAAGFRATTMQEIAERAGMSKVTLYSYFTDKEAVFAAVGFRLGDQILAAVTMALGSDTDVTDRIAAALVAKHRMVFKLVRQSPFAPELFDAKSSLVADYFRDLDSEICALIAATIASGAIFTGSGRLARIVFWAADGIASSGANFTHVADDIEHMVRAVLKS
jgi:AcrR family transcriptional regulator